MFTREKKIASESSYLDRAKKYGTMIVPALALFLASCSGNEKPSAETVKNYFEKNPTAERVAPEVVKQANESFVNFKDFIGKNFGTLDVRDSAMIEFNKEHYPGVLDDDEWQLRDDSTVIHTQFSPVFEKMQKEYEAKGDYSSIGIPLNQTEYIFHSNGDVEIAQGNLLENKTSDRLVYGRVSGEQGGVTSYYKADYGSTHSLRLTKEGVMEKASDYVEGTGQNYMQENLDELIKMVDAHVKKN